MKHEDLQMKIVRFLHVSIFLILMSSHMSSKKMFFDVCCYYFVL